MITIQQGDLLNAQGLLLHGCNAQGVMGSGVALSVKQRWPGVFQLYKRFCEVTPSPQRLGCVVFAETGDGVVVANCITQEFFGKDGAKYASYDLIDTCMISVGEYMAEYAIRTVHMPKIGCGLGGLNWRAVQAIVEHRLQNYDVVVYVLDQP